MEATGRLITNPSIDPPRDWERENKGVTPVFFIETVHFFEADGKTYRIAADGKPLTLEQEFVRIVVAGDSLAEACSPVDEAIKQRFAEQYAAWRENRENASSGFGFDECTFVNAKQARELEANNVFNLQDLAALADVNLHAVTNGRALREKAIAWLAAREADAPMLKMAGELATLRAEKAADQLRIARLEALVRPPKKKRRIVPHRQAVEASIAAKKAEEATASP